MDEEQIDRRAHWVQLVIGGIIAATIWCVKLEMTTSSLKSDMEIQKSKRDEMIARIVDKISQDHDQIIRDEKDIAWLKNERH